MKHHQKIYNNIVYLRDIQITIRNNSNYYNLSLSSKALNNGYIQNKDEFVKELSNHLKVLHLNKFIWHKKVLIITDFLYTYNEKKTLKEAFKEIGYKEIDISPLDSILKVNKEDYFLINGQNLRLLYVDNLNQMGSLELDSNLLAPSEIMLILKNRCNKKRLYLINEDDNLINLVDKLNLNYYYYEKKHHFF